MGKVPHDTDLGNYCLKYDQNQKYQRRKKEASLKLKPLICQNTLFRVKKNNCDMENNHLQIIYLIE